MINFTMAREILKCSFFKYWKRLPYSFKTTTYIIKLLQCFTVKIKIKNRLYYKVITFSAKPRQRELKKTLQKAIKEPIS
jgi:hypothetical protein